MTKKLNTPYTAHSLVACVALAIASGSAAEESFEPTWQLKADFAVVEPSGDAVAVGVSPASVDVDFDTMVGAGLRLEYRFTKALAVELGALGSSGFGVSVGDASRPLGVASRIDGFAPFTLGLNYHSNTGSHVDLYAGAFVAAIRYGDVTIETTPGRVLTDESANTDFGWGATAGIELPIGAGGWSLQANLRYIRTRIKLDPDEDVAESDFDPLILSIGIGYRF